MSILIKGVEMPKNCDECICNYDWHCMVTLKNLFFVDKTKRLEDCPLVEVPPHGRLIDADALQKKMIDYGWKHPDSIVHEFLEDDAPTIIEAEDEE